MALLTDLAARWRNDLASWAIPEEILASADESPWALSPAWFRRRADEQIAAPGGPSYKRVLEALPVGGTLLDIGAGAGAASLPAAAARGAAVIAVDLSEDMLDELAERAGKLGVPVTVVQGRWPDCEIAERADVAVTKDVLYNVPELPEFLAALTGQARGRVVVELTARHPLTPLNPLWMSLRGLRRPDRPAATDAYEIAAAMGLEPKIERWTRESPPRYETFDQLVEVTRTRLCLPSDRSGEVAAALRELGADPAAPRLPGTRRRQAVTLWWPSRDPLV